VLRAWEGKHRIGLKPRSGCSTIAEKAKGRGSARPEGEGDKDATRRGTTQAKGRRSVDNLVPSADFSQRVRVCH
jgi:hypothetical protein